MIDSKIYCFGEVLWDKFPSGKKPGGAPMNVAYHAKNLGLASYLCSAIWNDDDGKELLDFMNTRDLNTKYISILDEHPTGTVTSGRSCLGGRPPKSGVRVRVGLIV